MSIGGGMPGVVIAVYLNSTFRLGGCLFRMQVANPLQFLFKLHPAAAVESAAAAVVMVVCDIAREQSLKFFLC